MSILRISNLKKVFADMTAVDGLSLSVEEGEIHGILGPNGAGKSTTINCILGLLAIDGGSIEFAGGKSIREWSSNKGRLQRILHVLHAGIYANDAECGNCNFYLRRARKPHYREIPHFQSRNRRNVRRKDHCRNDRGLYSVCGFVCFLRIRSRR